MALFDQLSCQVYFRWLLSLNHTGPGEPNLGLVLIGKIFNNQQAQHGRIRMEASPKPPSSYLVHPSKDEPCL